MNLSHDICIKRSISRIKDNLFTDCYKNATKSVNTKKIYSPNFDGTIDLNNENKLFGLSVRIVAVESLIFLKKQYEFFESYLQSITFTDEEKNSLNLFYNNTVSLSVKLRKPIYTASIFKFFDKLDILNLINQVDWEIKDVISQHNNYIDILIQVHYRKFILTLFTFILCYFIRHLIICRGFKNLKKN